MVNASLSSNTLRAYKTAWRYLCSFTSLYLCNWVGDVKYMMAFVAYCHGKLSLSFNTIKLYLSGIQHFFSLHNPDRPSIFAAHPIKTMLKGILKSQGKPRLTRMPISGQMFCGLADLLSLSPFWVRSQFSPQGGCFP